MRGFVTGLLAVALAGCEPLILSAAKATVANSAGSQSSSATADPGAAPAADSSTAPAASSESAETTADPGVEAPAGPGTAAAAAAPRTLGRTWKAYQLDYSTDPPSSATRTITLAADGTFEMRSGSSYQAGDLSRMSVAGAGSGTYTLAGDALTLRFSDGSESAGAISGDHLTIDGKAFYPCSGWSC